MSIESSALLTDQYQLTMLQGYFDQEMQRTAVFEFFVRRLPPHRNFLVAAGLEQAVDFLERFHFSEDEIDWLSKNESFKPGFLKFLKDLRFTGEVDAMAEGTIFFANEPILRVTAPLPLAQLVETRLINLLQFQTMIASKAARCVLAAPGKTLVEFGLRRAHGAEAGLLASRAAYIAGFAGTSNVLAGKMFGVPLFGTMAHSFVQSHENEEDAFENFARSNPSNAVLLLDTYDTEAAARKVAKLALKLKTQGLKISAVRLDSGDLVALSKNVRRILNNEGLEEIRILASGNVDETELQKLVSAPIDGFGIGTRLVTSSDSPYLECVYKLQEYDGRAARKYSEGKTTWPGRKQVFRKSNAAGVMAGDILTLDNEAHEGQALLQPVMRKGKKISESEDAKTIRERFLAELNRLPEHLKQTEPAAGYRVSLSENLQRLAENLQIRHFKK